MRALLNEAPDCSLAWPAAIVLLAILALVAFGAWLIAGDE